MTIGKRTGWTLEQATRVAEMADRASWELAGIEDLADRELSDPYRAKAVDRCLDLRAGIFTAITMQIREDFPELKPHENGEN